MWGGNALDPNPLIAGLELASLYSPHELASAATAAQEAGLSPEEGVTYFIFLSATVAADKRRGFFQRLRNKFPPKSGSEEHRHIVMTNYAINFLLKGHLDETKSQVFADHYMQWLSR